MKKGLLAILIVFIIGFFSVLIFNREDTNAQSTSPSQQSSCESSSDPVDPASSPNEAVPESILPEDLASNPIHFVSSQQKGVSESGYYYTQQRADGPINIHYLDCNSASSIVLCSRPECSHNDESCRSWIASSSNVPHILSCGEQLILVYPGSPASASQNPSDAAARIDKMSADGSDVKTLHSFDSHYTLKTDFALSEHLLFYSAMYYPDLDSGEAHLVLEALNLETGETYRIHDFDSEAYFFIGAAGGNLYFKGIEGASASNSNPLDAQTHTIWRISASTGKREQVFSYKGDEYSMLLQDDALFYAIGQDRSIHKIDGENGEDSTLDVSAYLTQFLSEAAPNATNALFYPQFILGGKNLIVQVDTLGEDVSDTKNFLLNIDLSESSVTPISLTTDQGGGTIPLQVSAILDGTLVTVPRYNTQNVTVPASDGTMMTYTDFRPQYTLLSFDSYLNSKADYRIVQEK